MRLFFRVHLLFWLFFGLLPSHGLAQAPALEVISIEQGLSQGLVSTICQDDDGFLWFGTKNGLNRYDGYGFKVFKNDPFDPWSLPENEIVHIRAAGDFLLLETLTKTCIFHRKTHRIVALPRENWPQYSLTTLLVRQNRLWVVGSRHGNTQSELLCVQWPPDVFERLDKGQAPEAVFEVKQVLQLPANSFPAMTDDEQQCWLVDEGQLTAFTLASGTKRSMPLPLRFLEPPQPITIIPDVAGAVWLHQVGKMARFDGQSWQVFALPFKVKSVLSFDRKNGRIWFSNQPDVMCLDLKRRPFDPTPIHRLHVPEGAVNGFTDHLGNFWIGTDALGIRKFTPQNGLFRNYMEKVSILCRPVPNGRGKVLMTDIRRNGPKCLLLDLSSGKTQELRLSDPTIVFGPNPCADEQGRFWLVTSSRPTKLVQYDPESGQEQYYPLPAELSDIQPVLKKNDPVQIWLLSDQHIARFDLSSRTFTVCKTIGTAPIGEVIAAERDPNGIWWIGASGGLLKAEPLPNNNSSIGEGQGETFRFSLLVTNTKNRNSLPGNFIKSLLADPADPNVLWVGTNGQGMCRFDTPKGQFLNFNTQNGLPDDVVYGILADDGQPHKLWISTNRGLARFDPATRQFQYFLKSDGLPDNEFNTRAAYKAPSGEMLFGTVSGLTIFHPKDLGANRPPPAVRLTDVSINGKTASPRDAAAVLRQDVAALGQLDLPFSQNSLLLSFAAMDFTSPSRNRFAYYLEGAEADWAHQGFEHTAQYLNLAPGTYTFRVKGANSAGIWSEQVATLKIVVHPPWYRSWPAYLLYAALLAGGIYFFYQNQLRRRLEKAEATRLRDLDDFKNRFFTNITHEFRTPLTVILGTNQQLADGSDRWAIESERPLVKHKLSLIKRNGESLLRLINQLLDLAKLESGSLKINYVQGNVLPYLRYIAESLHSLANAQNVLLRVESDEARIIMDYDPERLLQIVHNLLSNAIKFTPEGGRVVLHIARAPDLSGFQNQEGLLVIRVTDTGAGIPPEDMPHIFDRYFQANNLEKAKAGGTGIGLALTKELMGLLGGKISVESTVNKGSTFTILLPITQRAPLEDKEAALSSPVLPAREPAVPTPAPIAGRPAVLIMEDNPDVVDYLSACLTPHYAMDFAYNGRAGIEKAIETVPDLIISDVMMPEKDGFEVCETLKNDERTSHIPIVLLTAKAGVENRIAGLRRGADAYLAKPFQEEELLVWVEQLIARRRLLQARYIRLSAPDTAAEPIAAELALEDSFMKKLQAVLQAHYSDTEFSVDALCRQMAMSRTQIHRKLSALTNRSTTEHINAYRLEKSRQLLLEGKLNISEVAFQVGFNDPKYFSRLFTEAYGTAPSALRK